MLEVQQVFRKHFGHPPTYTVQAPGQIDLLGNPTDSNQGLVLAMATDHAAFISTSARTDGRVQLISSLAPSPESFSVLDDARSTAAFWTDSIKSTLSALRQRQAHCSGFNAAIHESIPADTAPVNRAALTVATALAVRELHPFTLTPTGVTVPPRRAKDGSLPPLSTAEKIEMAKVCHAAERNLAEAGCELFHPMASLFGKAFHAVEIDFQSFTIEHVPMMGEIAFVLCDSGVRPSPSDAAPGELQNRCKAAARALGVKSLRSVDIQFLNSNRKRLAEREYQCASHIVGENQRVVAGSRALRDGDFAQFGQFLFQSHASSRENLHNGSAELDLLVSLAKTHPACLGARLTGRGFGGATINLVQRAQVESFIKAISTVYEKQTGRKIQPRVCQCVDGAR